MSKQGLKWTVEEMVTLYERRLMDVPYKVIAEELDRTEQACWDKYRHTDWSNTGIPDKIRESIKDRRVEAVKEQAAATTDRKLDMFRLRANVIADKLADATTSLPEAPLVPWSPSGEKTEHQNEDMGLILSDLHIGHEHSNEETGGLSAYNLEIFQNRLENLKQAVPDIYELHSQLYKLPKLHIFCLGDIVDGMNEAGAWSPVFISMPIWDQVTHGIHALSDAIWYWLTFFEEIHFYGIRGNHGRVARSGAEKDYCNWDIIAYEFLQTRFQDNDRIKFHVPRCWWSLEEVCNHNFLLIHGDDVKSKGVPILGMLDLERKMAATLNKKINYTLAGHFHNASEYTTHSGRLIMNGSFVGADVYSLKNAMPGTRAEQKLFGIHPQRGITWMYNIDLDHQRGKNATDSKVGSKVS